MTADTIADDPKADDPTRRDFLFIATGAVGVVGAGLRSGR